MFTMFVPSRSGIDATHAQHEINRYGRASVDDSRLSALGNGGDLILTRDIALSAAGNAHSAQPLRRRPSLSLGERGPHE
jgi:hypothetical protein